ncbi:unnamed protein product, partial [Brassica rapa subsp. narinosa]
LPSVIPRTHSYFDMKAWSARVTLTSKRLFFLNTTSKRLQTGDFGIIFISTTHRRSCGSSYATITPQTVESLCTPKLVALRLLTDGATYHVLIAHKNYNADSHLQGAVTRMLLVVYLNYHHCETSHEVDRRGAENTTGCLETTVDEGSTMDSTPLPCQTETVVSIDSKASGVRRKQQQCSKSIS